MVNHADLAALLSNGGLKGNLLKIHIPSCLPPNLSQGHQHRLDSWSL